MKRVGDLGVGSLIGSVIGAGASIFGASEQADAAKQAAKDQLTAANNAIAEQKLQFQTAQADLQPYNAGGQSVYQGLVGSLNALNQPFTPSDLTKTPGYQFTLQQGQDAVNNSLASQGLAKSGAAVKAGANYAAGLASNTFQQQFGNYLSQQQQHYNQLAGVSQLGEAAGAGTAGNAITTGQGIASSTISGGNALAAGANLGGQAYGQAANNVGAYLASASQGGGTGTNSGGGGFNLSSLFGGVSGGGSGANAGLDVGFGGGATS